MGSNPVGDASIARYANWQSGEAQTFVICGFDSHPCYSIGSCSSWLPVKQSSQNKRGGRREVQFLHDPLTMARSSIGSGREPLKLADAGSIPARVTDNMAKWWNWETRDAQNVVPIRHGSSTLPLVTELTRIDRRWASAQLGLISPDRRVRLPDLQLDMPRYANWQSGEVESLVILWVRLPLSVTYDPVVQRQDAWPTSRKAMVQFHPGSLDETWSVGVSAAHLLGKDEGRVQFPDGPLTNKSGCWSNGTTPGLQPGDRGSTPRRSTE